MFIRFSYVPRAFCESTSIPLMKCKTGNLTDVNNNRAIALSNAITKILNNILFKHIASEDEMEFRNEIFNLALRSDTQLQTVHLCLKELLNIIGTRV